MSAKTRVVGLTGGIACGKSTVSAMFRALGFAIVDADQLARDVVALGTPGLADIAARFPGVLFEDGTLNRTLLAERIFRDPSERAALNALLHPRIREASEQAIRGLEAQGAPVVLYDAALLIENGLQAGMQGVILVSLPKDVQQRRLMARDHLTVEQADARLDSQMSLDDKRPHATWVIDNSGSLEATQAQVQMIAAALPSSPSVEWPRFGRKPP